MSAMKRFAEWAEEKLYGPESVFTPEEQAATRRGYTTAERVAESGRVFGAYPQAISEGHAAKLDQHWKEWSEMNKARGT